MLSPVLVGVRRDVYSHDLNVIVMCDSYASGSHALGSSAIVCVAFDDHMPVILFFTMILLLIQGKGRDADSPWDGGAWAALHDAANTSRPY